MPSYFIYNAIAFILIINNVKALRCLSCKGVTDIASCERDLARCDEDTEECYLDVSTDTLLRQVFHAGCRAKNICDMIGQAGGRKRVTKQKRTGVACSQCCNQDRDDLLPCNGFLCKQSILKNQTCVDCDMARHPYLCKHYINCQKNEVCSQFQYISENMIYHDLGCIRKEICRQFLQHSNIDTSIVGKKRSGITDICFACCDEINCNRQNCYDIRDSMTITMFD